MVESDPHGEMSWGHESVEALIAENERLRHILSRVALEDHDMSLEDFVNGWPG